MNNFPPFRFHELHDQPVLTNDAHLYYSENTNHQVQSTSTNKLHSYQENHQVLCDQEKIYYTLAPERMNEGMIINSNNMPVVALDFSTNQQDLSQTCKRKLAEGLEHDKATKKANIHSDNESNVESPISEYCINPQSINSMNEDGKEKNLIYHILNKSYKGKLVLAAYNYDEKYKEKFKKFDNYSNKLADIIIDYEFMNNNFDIKRHRFMYLRNEICTLFNGQVLEEWYSPSTAECSAKGFLYSAYRKYRERSIELQIFGGTLKQRTQIKSNTSNNADVDHTEISNTTTINDNLIKQWVSLIDGRKNVYKNSNVSNLLCLYPCLTRDFGYKFILADFQHLYGEKSTSLFLKWPTVSNNIISLAKNESSKSPINKAFIQYSLLSISNEILAFLLLPFILKATNQFVTKKGCSLTNQDYLDVFIFEANEFSDLEDLKNFTVTHEKIENIYAKIDEECVKPYVVVCGSFSSISATYVVLSKDCKYKLESLVEAVDVLTKLSFLVKKAGSKPLKQLLQFFEFYVYSTNDKSIYKNVINLVKKLKA